MLDISRLQYTDIIEYALDVAVDPTESGLAMVRTANASGKEQISLSSGTGDKFLGVLYLDKHAATKGVRVGYSLQVPATSPLTVVLPDSTGVANLVVYSAAGAVYATTTDYTVSGTQLTFVAGHAGETVTVSYNYTLSAAQLNQLGVSPIASASAFIRRASIFRGYTRIYVSNFKVDDAYAVGDLVKTAANGFFVGAAGTGVATTAVVVSVPTAADPWLGLEYNV